MIEVCLLLNRTDCPLWLNCSKHSPDVRLPRGTERESVGLVDASCRATITTSWARAGGGCREGRQAVCSSSYSIEFWGSESKRVIAGELNSDSQLVEICACWPSEAVFQVAGAGSFTFSVLLVCTYSEQPARHPTVMRLSVEVLNNVHDACQFMAWISPIQK